MNLWSLVEIHEPFGKACCIQPPKLNMAAAGSSEMFLDYKILRDHTASRRRG
jgi:hypothetical protein